MFGFFKKKGPTELMERQIDCLFKRDHNLQSDVDTLRRDIAHLQTVTKNPAPSWVQAQEQFLNLLVRLQELQEDNAALKAFEKAAAPQVENQRQRIEDLEGQLRLVNDTLSALWEYLGVFAYVQPASPSRMVVRQKGGPEQGEQVA